MTRITAATLALSFTIGCMPAVAAPPPGKVLSTATVDGFTVNVLRFPTVAHLPKPTSTAGSVGIGANVSGTSPYGGTSLAGSPFLSMDEGGSVVFKLKQAAGSVLFIWGTPDPYNTVNLYDTSGNLIGSLNGGDIATAFGFSTGQYTQIVSPTPVGMVTASSGGCCFEVGNMGETLATIANVKAH